ncbi:hypothetical protein ACQCVP_01110 [Rossellomorea vietnamensis]|uniref:hypothetical protein n=1 Tax=Rossellomorea vietnamensis TaxID=218284 RepID=UPI003CF7FED9
MFKKWKRLGQPRQANVLKRKKAGFPFLLLRLFDPEGLGAATRYPLVPQAVARLPFHSPYVKEGKKIFKCNNFLEKRFTRNVAVEKQWISAPIPAEM